MSQTSSTVSLIRIAVWIIRLVLVAAILGVLAALLLPDLTAGKRLASCGIAIQVAGIAFTVPELAQRLTESKATDLIIWADTFLPLWHILAKLHFTRTLGQLSRLLLIGGAMSVLVGLILQYMATYYN